MQCRVHQSVRFVHAVEHWCETTASNVFESRSHSPPCRGVSHAEAIHPMCFAIMMRDHHHALIHPFGFCYEICVAMSGQLLIHKTEKLNLALEINRYGVTNSSHPGGVTRAYSLSSMLEMSLFEY